MPKIRRLPKNLETFGQLSTKHKARLAAGIETRRTGKKHNMEKTICYRVATDSTVEAFRCWAVVLAPNQKRFY